MDTLVLGGTAFLGRHVTEELLAAGHAVTCLARGSAPVPDGAALVSADRDEDDALAPVADHHWDLVVDVTRIPGHCRRAVRDLDTGHRVLVSTANVYADHSRPEQDEQGELRAALASDEMGSMEFYGEAKVACEEAVRGARGTATIIRAALLGGPGDETGRSGYWPWRFAHPVADAVAVPDAPAYPTALLDARDLAGWIRLASEHRIEGTFNAAGPTTELAVVLAAAQQAAGSAAAPRPVPEQVRRAHGIGAWMGPDSFPLWIDDPDLRGMPTLDAHAAREAGLVTRPLTATFRDTLRWLEAAGPPTGAGLSDDTERSVLQAASAG